MQLDHFVSQRFYTQPESRVTQTPFPKISVITPSYGQELFIERTILSVLNQNYPNLEFIVVDDASKDGSNNIINKYKGFLTLVGDGINRGQTAAINYGLKRATGDIITFQNADDLFAPDAFYEVAKAFQRHPESKLFFGNIYIIDQNDAINNAMRMTPYSYEEQLYLGMQMHNQSMFFKPILLENNGFLNEDLNYSFDYEIILRFTEKGDHQPRYVEKLWGAFRIHSASKTTNITPAYSQERITISQAYQNRQIKITNSTFIRLKAYCRKTSYYLKQGNVKYLLYKLKNTLLL